MPNPKILIVVEGGVAEPVCASGGWELSEVDVIVVDRDQAKIGENSVREFCVVNFTPMKFAEALRKAKENL